MYGVGGNTPDKLCKKCQALIGAYIVCLRNSKLAREVIVELRQGKSSVG